MLTGAQRTSKNKHKNILTGLIFVASVKIMASIDKLGYDDVVLVQDDVGIEKSLAVCFTQLLPHHQYICEIST